MHRTAIITATLATTLLLASCGSNGSDGKADSKPAATSTAPAKPGYDLSDCKDLLEQNYTDENVHDASSEPECKGLTRRQYLSAVKDVLTGHKDDILERSAKEVTWDSAWEQTDSDQQNLVCERLQEDGADVVGKEMADSTGGDIDEQVDMAQYLLDEKC
ncbi:hypothetical protein ACFCWG_41070 [Streptomyces sp. NPDC056390]|uniref:hypothetical protein n=1 Tax=Streptomyces sp. NPDC056390 TaxID=3345806 RepID=UPI0035D96A4B